MPCPARPATPPAATPPLKPAKLGHPLAVDEPGGRSCRQTSGMLRARQGKIGRGRELSRAQRCPSGRRAHMNTQSRRGPARPHMAFACSQGLSRSDSPRPAPPPCRQHPQTRQHHNRREATPKRLTRANVPGLLIPTSAETCSAAVLTQLETPYFQPQQVAPLQAIRMMYPMSTE